VALFRQKLQTAAIRRNQGNFRGCKEALQQEEGDEDEEDYVLTPNLKAVF